MKKILFSVMALAGVTSLNAQTFFNQTSFRGAFAPAPTDMWTQGWTNWDPQNTTYPAPTATITGTISASANWAAGTTVLLQGPVYVTNNSTLTIDAGVVVRCSKAAAGSALIITKGSVINAVGTASNPIVFTSDQNAGSRALGDWGGVIILGNAALNFTNGVNNIEGLPVSSNSQFGGGSTPNNDDNSGMLKYVRIEYGGYVYGTNQEINGLTLGAVGRGTTLEYIQTSFTNDDAFEWFGGNVNAKWLVSYRNLDDDFDTDNGWSGNVQYGLIVRDPNLADNPSVSTSEGFESDNDANGTTASPLTSGVFSNVTMIGPFRGSTTNTIAAGYRRAVRIRRNSNLKVFNSIFMDTQRGVHIDGALCETSAGNGSLKFKNNIIAGMSQRAVEQNTTNTFGTNAGATTSAWFMANANDSIHSSMSSFSVILTTPYNYTSPDYRPGNNSIALAGASFTDAAIGALTIGVSEITTKIGFIGLFPNPTSGATTLLIDAKNATSLSVSINDVTGKLVASPITNQTIANGENKFTLNTVGLSNGIYFVTLSAAQGKETVKLIVNH
jgi:hypothetical protein